MFDYFYYEGKEYQTKDTPNQGLSKYKIEHDQESGHQFLWVEECDSEWVVNPERLCGGYIKESNHHWVRCDDFDGTIDFYCYDEKNDSWIEYHSLFMDGRVIKLEKE